MLTDAVLLDISQAQRQIDQLERELARLSEPVRVPVDIQGERAVDELRRDFQGADAGVAELNSELAETTRELNRVDRAADDSSDAILRVGTRGVSAFSSLRTSVIGAAAAFAAIAGTRAFVNFAGGAIQAASDLEESISKTNVVFGDFSGEIQEFARTGPQALGLANREALAFTSTFGNLFVALGLSQQEAAELSPQIVQLGADLASFNNIDVSEALEKLRSGLVGEAEPLRTLGVNINEAVTSAKAMELGLVGVNGELSEAAKVQARYALILEQTVTAQGDFARTADGIANRQRTLAAQFEDLRAAIGEALLPVFERLLDAAPRLLEGLEDLIPVIQSFSTSLASVDPSGIGEVVQVLAEVPGVLGRLLSIGDATFDILEGITSLDFSKVGAGFAQIGDAIDDRAVRVTINGLVNDLQRGVEPAIALRDALADLSDQDLEQDKFEEFSQSLIAIASLDPTALAALRVNLRALGPALGFTTDELAFLNRELAVLDAQNVTSPEKLRRLGREAEDIVRPLSEGAQAILDLRLAGESLEEFAPDLGTQGFIDGLDEMTTAMSGAQEALRDDEGQIVDDLDTFLSNLNEVFADQLDFARNISVLRSRGLDQLADVFEEAGLEAASALADAVSDPGAAAEANRAIAEQGSALARAEFAAFDTEIKQLIAGYEPDAVVIPLTFGGLPDIPISAITAGGIVNVPGRAGATEINTTIVVQSNEELPSGAQRAVQIINSGVNASRTGPS